jgi:hypothetical protein
MFATKANLSPMEKAGLLKIPNGTQSPAGAEVANIPIPWEPIRPNTRKAREKRNHLLAALFWRRFVTPCFRMGRRSSMENSKPAGL